MQSKVLLRRTECPEPIFKGWLRAGVIVPARPGDGPGTHADYDEANALALLLAVKMKNAGIVVTNYARAFVVLQEWLRDCSSLEWPNHVVQLAQDSVKVHTAKKPLALDDLALIAPLAPLCHLLSGSTDEPSYYQYPLLGLQAIRNTR